MDEVKYEPDPAIWLVYSREHNAFWRPAHCGYTHLVEEAGRYTYADASGICRDANRHIEHARHPKEVMVVAPEAAVLAIRYRQFQHIVYEERDEVLSKADDGEYEAMRAAMDFEHRGFRFEDFYDYNVREYSHRFLWCCHALSWAIAKYDARPR